MSGVRWSLALAGVVVLSVITLVWWTRGGVPIRITATALDAPARIEAGEPIEIDVWASVLDGAAVPVAVFTGVASFEYRVPIEAGRGSLVLDGALTHSSGVVTISVSGRAGVVSKVVTIEAGPPSGQLVPLVGPRTIVANGEDHTMVVAIPADEHGNMVPSGTQARVTARHPDGTIDEAIVRTANGLAHTTLDAGTRAGTTTVSTVSGRATGPAVELAEVADAPERIELVADQRSLLADGRSLHRLRTDTLQDRFGNVLPDGVTVRFVVEDPSGMRQLSSVVMRGGAEVMMEAPDLPGEVRIIAMVAGVTSDPLMLDFSAAVAQLPVAVASADGRWVIEVGPVLDSLGAHLPDGTVVTVADQIALLHNGTALLMVDRIDDVVIDVLGVRARLEESR